MAGSLNRVDLIGNVGKDPEIRTTQSGKKIANLTIATSESWNDKQSGERKERTEWHRVAVMSDALAGVVERNVKKGYKLFVSGQLQTRKWTDQSGNERYTTEVVLSGFSSQLIMLDGKRDAPRDDVGYQQQPKPQTQDTQRNSAPPPPDLDSEVPF